MKVLVAVKTCHRLDYHVDDQTIDWLNQRNLRYTIVADRVAAQRETWMTSDFFARVHPNFSVDYKFFYGSTLRRDPERRTQKDLNILRSPESDEVFLPCGDNYTANATKVREICKWAIAHGYTNLVLVDDDTYIDPARLITAENLAYDYAGGGQGCFAPGSCIFLSRRAMERLVASPILSYADDLWIGSVMTASGITRHVIDSIRHEFGDSYRATVDDEGYAAIHSCTPKVMRALWTLRTMSLSQQPKATDGQVSKTTPSPLANQDSGDVKSSSFVTSPESLGKLSLDSDLNLSITQVPEITPSSSDSESSVTG